MTQLTQPSDVLVIGAGLAGGIAALRAADMGKHVTLLSLKQGFHDAASFWAQGGIVYKGEGDPALLKDDIFSTGCGRNNRTAVDILAQEGPARVDEWLLRRLEVPFDRDERGNLHRTREAAHSNARILHVKDFTGSAITERLTHALQQHPRVQWRLGTAVELLLSHVHDTRPQASWGSARVCGAYALMQDTGQVEALTAHATVLATGGYSQLFLHSTGPRASRGDGLALAHRAGARTVDLEYVQFHPTALFLAGEPRRLLSEALRGEGAQIRNLKGERFLDELAPRDVVSRAIHEETLNSGALHVWLDLRPIARLEERFPSIVALLKSKGFDPAHSLIPIVPAAHYTMGGVWTDMHGATSVPGLFAAGEVACTGLHGASRLASTSLLEALVFAHRAGEAVAKQSGSSLDFDPRPWTSENEEADPALIQQDWRVLRQTLWNYVGLVRSPTRLRRAESILSNLRNEVESFYKSVKLSDELIGLRNASLVGTLVLYAALRNRSSLGAHFLKSED